MKPSAEILANAPAGGTKLTGNEASVVLASSDVYPRVWLGHQSDGTLTAYFETEHELESPFSISQVISVHGIRVEDESARGTAICAVKVACHDRKLDQVFCSFLDEVREHVTDGADAVEVIQMCASEWRTLLQVATTLLSANAAAGIFGELCFLESLVVELGIHAVNMWQRSPHEMHDFIGHGARVEVKTSAFQDRSVITVHGLRQLEPPVTGTLTLAVAEVQRHGSESIDDVVVRLRQRGVSGELLTEKLRDVGYVVGMPGSQSFKFDLRSWRFWEVASDVAVLNRSAVSAEIDDAVSSLSYALNLSALGEAAEVFEFHRLECVEGQAS